MGSSFGLVMMLPTRPNQGYAKVRQARQKGPPNPRPCRGVGVRQGRDMARKQGWANSFTFCHLDELPGLALVAKAIDHHQRLGRVPGAQHALHPGLLSPVVDIEVESISHGL